MKDDTATTDDRAVARSAASLKATLATVAGAAPLAPAVIVTAALLVGCATFRVESAWVSARAGGVPQSGAGAVESSSPKGEPPLCIEIGRESGGGAGRAAPVGRAAERTMVVDAGAGATPAAQQARNTQAVRISGGPLLGALLQGVAQPDGAGGWTISLTSLHWFNNWHNGWTEAAFVVDGSFDLERSGSAWRVVVKSSPEIDGPSAATIRYFDQYLGGEEALDQFTDRWNRIEAYAELLRSRYGGSWPASERSLERLLFPEVYGYDRPPAPRHASVEGGGVRWNSDYTQAVFPKELQPIRDSGTMLRDWEESPGLWQLAFRWKDFWATDIQADLFQSVKP